MSTSLSSPTTYRRLHGEYASWSGAEWEHYLTACELTQEIVARLDHANLAVEDTTEYLDAFTTKLPLLPLPMADGKARWTVVEDSAVPGLVIHQHPDTRVWRITHRRSLRALGWLPSRSTALKACDGLAYLADWTQSRHDLEPHGTRLVPLVKALLVELGGHISLRPEVATVPVAASASVLIAGTPRRGKSAWGGAA
jgi:hypothetical protein